MTYNAKQGLQGSGCQAKSYVYITEEGPMS